MRWNCPHCGIQLAVADDKLPTGWAFSRCFKCGGFGLIRRMEVNVIKVDKAPPGEKVLLPEASEEPRISEIATQKIRAVQSAVQGAVAPMAVAAPRRAIPVAVAAVIASGLVFALQAQNIFKRSSTPVVSATDQIKQAPMAAPIRDSKALQLFARVRAPQTKAYSGPGLEFSVAGIANQQIDYVVLDWNDRWFKLATRGAADAAESVLGWVRNDLVQLLPKN